MKLSLGEVLKRGIGAHKAGDADQASRFYVSIIRARPEHPDANHNQGLIFLETGQLEAAKALFKKSLDFDPSVSQFWLSYIDVLGRLKAFDEAETLLNSLKRKQVWGESLSELESQIRNLKDEGKSSNKSNSKKKRIKLSSAKITSENDASSYIRKGDKCIISENLDSAIENYRRALKLSPRAGIAHNNLGFALKKKGDLTLAEEHYRNACEVDPSNPRSHFNLGNLYLEREQFERAIEKFETALEIEPDYTEALLNFGVVLQKQGKLQDALTKFKMAIEVDPNLSDGHYNIGVILHESGKLAEAAPFYLVALKLNPENDIAKLNLAICLRVYRFDENRPGAQEIILNILEEGWSRPSEACPSIISLIKHESAVQNAWERRERVETADELSNKLKELSKVPLFIKILGLCCIPDLPIEELLSRTRHSILSHASEIESDAGILAFVSALALQCFLNEYLYLESEDEKELVLNLESKISERLRTGEQPKPIEVLIIACYRPLNSFSFSPNLASCPEILDVYTQQVTEPEREGRIMASMESLAEVTDDISTKVQEQYETHPYPRWVTPFRQDKLSFCQYAERQDVRIDTSVNDFASPSILVAGCGTGQHPIETALKYENCTVVAIDLSKSSLAYAMRKTSELGIQNIKYIHADILQAKKLNQKFDIIESSGVLHHMRDPLKGWQILSECLHPGGVMRIGLYSKLARQHISKIRGEIKEAGISSDPSSIRNFRQSLLSSDKEHHKSMILSGDFFGLSLVHDILFNVQEHLFTLPQIQNALAELGLVFCGFDNPKNLTVPINDHIDKDSIYNLHAWDTLEANNTNLFIEMYQFWCQRQN